MTTVAELSARSFADWTNIIDPSPTRSADPALDERRAALEADPEAWIAALFPRLAWAGFAPHHHAHWAWVQRLVRGVRPVARINVWARGGAKSSSAEASAVYAGATGKRRYVWYVSGTQPQADRHVGAIAKMLEGEVFARHYPGMAERAVNKYGHSRGWSGSRLTTASGFTVDAIGLDVAVRGMRQDEQRPDMLIFDDIDGCLDSQHVVRRKIVTLTTSIIPAGSGDLAILGIQNLIHGDSIFTMLVDGRADFLADREVSGPIPAVLGLEWEMRRGDDGIPRPVIVAGEPTWQGQDLVACQGLMLDIGPTAFLAEAQHEIEERVGGLFGHLDYDRCNADEVPATVRTGVWLDPAVTATDGSDSQGIIADSLGVDSRIYRRYAWEGVDTPLNAFKRALLVAVELGARVLGVETNQGGDTWKSVFREAWRELQEEGKLPEDARPPRYLSVKATTDLGGKVSRASVMLAEGYERGRFVHLRGPHATLERALNRFPVKKPFDLVDASYWSWAWLAGKLDDNDAAMLIQGATPGWNPPAVW